MSHPTHMSRREALIAGAAMLWSLAATRSRASSDALVTEAVLEKLVPLAEVLPVASRHLPVAGLTY